MKLLDAKLLNTPQKTALSGLRSLSLLDPRAKLIGAILLGLAVLASPNLIVVGFLLALALFSTLFAGLKFKALFYALVPINFFLLFTWLTLPFSFHSLGEQRTVLFSGFYLDHAGLRFCFLSTLKTNATAIFLFSLCHGLSPATLGSALQALKVPNKLCTLFIMMCRHIFILIEEFQNSLRALRLRSSNLISKNKISYSLKIYAFFMASVLIHAADRAEKVRLAMLCKGYTHIFQPNLELKWQRPENNLIISCVFILISSILISLAFGK